MFQKKSRSTRVIGLAALSLLLGLSGCSTPWRGPAVPNDVEECPPLLGNPGIRSWGDRLSQPFIDELVSASRRGLEIQESTTNDGLPPRSYFLAISGGSDDGAFAAGLLC